MSMPIASVTMQEPMTLRIPATLESLHKARQFMLEQCAGLGVGPELSGHMELVLEELVVNIGSYAYPGSEGDLEIACGLGSSGRIPGTADMVCLLLRDWGVAFDPLAADDPDVEADALEREIGGLGIYLVREMADHCAYERNGDCNEFRVCMRLNRSE